eukprot:CAMPEP_0117077230 /NCGR_PEP_ID=MMETSP0472-20121206/54452_1 /TAXON_ID=693140 ORGANISM="Tiarina fusus, Strain LIS" /NCGR_SAMPLE_ID=MMETSP0472 /ASSEMBLY_ACC=CAM_ASM_000603 /LENGTH=65 /DNA_ID=CAMNT_0004803475 /DNA_START=26 /DNA_END=223 /DNA_ORIENTATION=-
MGNLQSLDSPETRAHFERWAEKEGCGRKKGKTDDYNDRLEAWRKGKKSGGTNHELDSAAMVKAAR